MIVMESTIWKTSVRACVHITNLLIEVGDINMFQAKSSTRDIWHEHLQVIWETSEQARNFASTSWA